MKVIGVFLAEWVIIRVWMFYKFLVKYSIERLKKKWIGRFDVNSTDLGNFLCAFGPKTIFLFKKMT